MPLDGINYGQQQPVKLSAIEGIAASDSPDAAVEGTPVTTDAAISRPKLKLSRLMASVAMEGKLAAMLDADGDGEVSADEARPLDVDGDGRISQADVQKLDRDGDGTIEWKELGALAADRLELVRDLDALGEVIPDVGEYDTHSSRYSWSSVSALQDVKDLVSSGGPDGAQQSYGAAAKKLRALGANFGRLLDGARTQREKARPAMEKAEAKLSAARRGLSRAEHALRAEKTGGAPLGWLDERVQEAGSFLEAFREVAKADPSPEMNKKLRDLEDAYTQLADAAQAVRSGDLSGKQATEKLRPASVLFQQLAFGAKSAASGDEASSSRLDSLYQGVKLNVMAHREVSDQVLSQASQHRQKLGGLERSVQSAKTHVQEKVAAYEEACEPFDRADSSIRDYQAAIRQTGRAAKKLDVADAYTGESLRTVAETLRLPTRDEPIPHTKTIDGEKVQGWLVEKENGHSLFVSGRGDVYWGGKPLENGPPPDKVIESIADWDPEKALERGLPPYATLAVWQSNRRWLETARDDVWGDFDSPLDDQAYEVTSQALGAMNRALENGDVHEANIAYRKGLVGLLKLQKKQGGVLDEEIAQLEVAIKVLETLVNIGEYAAAKAGEMTGGPAGAAVAAAAYKFAAALAQGKPLQGALLDAVRGLGYGLSPGGGNAVLQASVTILEEVMKLEGADGLTAEDFAKAIATGTVDGVLTYILDRLGDEVDAKGLLAVVTKVLGQGVAAKVKDEILGTLRGHIEDL